jgi:ribosomal protein S12 methylthiotransferase accessory factor
MTCFEYEGVECTIGPASFVSTAAVTEWGHARSLEETYAWVKPLLRRVPITRVADATPLDSLGLPVWCAVTPLAKDLTVHAGKGANARAAELSAIMEAIERVCAESVPANRTRRASYADLCAERGPAALDPETLNLPFETTYAPDRPISWTLGYDVAQREHLWVPLDAALSPAQEGVCHGVETNGLAAGNTVTEAALHALYELVERDASSGEQFVELFADAADQHAPRVRMVDTAQLGADARAWIDRLVANGLRVAVQELTSDIGVPVFGAFVIDEAFPGNPGRTTTFSGHGCDLSARRAVFRALTEATQAHSVVLLGARDAFEGTRPLPDRGARLRRRLDVLHARRHVAFRADDLGSGDLWRDMQAVLERLSAVGLRRCVVVDLTRPDVGVPVVRVIVPGLEHPYAFSARRPGPRLLRKLL